MELLSSLERLPPDYLLSIAGVVGAYLVIALLVLSIGTTSRWMGGIKVAAIVVTGFFFVQSYNSTVALTGWPTFDRPPAKFVFHWATKIEPNKFYSEAGAVYLWLEPLDAGDTPSGTPRAYRLPFSHELAQQVEAAEEKIRDGATIVGTADTVDRAMVPAAAADTLDEHGERVRATGAALMPETFVTEPVVVRFAVLEGTGAQAPVLAPAPVPAPALGR